MLTIHQIINIRGEVQEGHNLINVSFYNVKKPIGENKRPFYNLVQYCIKGRMLLDIQINSGFEVCRECSSAAGRTIEHYKKPVFNEYLTKPIVKKYSKQLTQLNEYF